ETKGIDSERLDKARELFKQGKYEQVLAVLDEKQIDKDIAEYEEKGKILAAELTIKAQTVVLNKHENWFAEANRLFEKAVSISENYDTTKEYAYFLAEHNQINKAIELCTKALNYCSGEEEVAKVLLSLSNLQNTQSDFKNSEISFNKASKIKEKLAAKTNDIFSSEYADSLYLLGTSHLMKSEHEKAENIYIEVLKIYRKLADTNRNDFLPKMAFTLNNLGNIQSLRNETEKAENSYQEALEIRRKLANKEPSLYLPDLANSLIN